MHKLVPWLLFIVGLLIAGLALADNIAPLNLAFQRIAGDSAADQVNLSLRITQVGDQSVLLEFKNLSPLESVVSEIYLQDLDRLIRGLTIQNQESVGQVLFYGGAHPPELPGGQSYNFETTMAMEAKNPSPRWGIKPNETLKVLVELNSSAALNSLITGLQQQKFRVGLHVQSIGGKDSASFVNLVPPPQDAVPEPATLALAGSALLGSWVLRRRLEKRGRKSKQPQV